MSQQGSASTDLSNLQELEVKSKITPLKIKRDRLLVLDQLLLPHTSAWIECFDEKDTATVIRNMNVRGAPAIGIAAAYGFYLGVWKLAQQNKKINEATLLKIQNTLNSSRPTAVNLFWATQVMLHSAQTWLQEHAQKAKKKDYTLLLLRLYDKAIHIHEDDRQRCLEMSRNGAEYILQNFPKPAYRVLTHCNTGSLATGGIGTALGVIRFLHELRKIETVYADETRPYLQGARLTAYELWKEKIPLRLSVDSQAAFLMQKGLVDFVIVGADRIAENRDTANKIGTYSLAVLAAAHNIPFFVAAPLSTFDKSLSNGEQIPIEERKASEVLTLAGVTFAPRVEVLNYSFDVTPSSYINAIFHEQGCDIKK